MSSGEYSVMQKNIFHTSFVGVLSVTDKQLKMLLNISDYILSNSMLSFIDYYFSFFALNERLMMKYDFVSG